MLRTKMTLGAVGTCDRMRAARQRSRQVGPAAALRRLLQPSPSRLGGAAENLDCDRLSSEARRRLRTQAGRNALGDITRRRPGLMAAQVRPQASLRGGAQPAA